MPNRSYNRASDCKTPRALAGLVPVLFTLKDSEYKKIPETDCYDAVRNAFNYTGNKKLIAHPPCRSWSRTCYALAKPERHEYTYALWAYELVKKYGGILEHPIKSRLWEYINEKPYPVDMGWYGHPMKKTTGLLFIDVDIPEFEMEFRNDYKWINRVSKRQAMYTPLKVCKILVKSIINS